MHNRRKARMGFSLQNHLAAVFDGQRIRYQAQALTEDKNRPDFLFPGGREYRDERFDSSLLVMLGAKSTLKERWRQILAEANRIPHKHLCTLQPGISSAQTQQISDANVQLVIPQRFHETYSEQQRRSIWSVSRFVEFVRAKQRI